MAIALNGGLRQDVGYHWLGLVDGLVDKVGCTREIMMPQRKCRIKGNPL